MHSNVIVALAVAASLGLVDHGAPGGFSTLVLTPLAIEGLTADDAGNLYTTGRAGVNGTRAGCSESIRPCRIPTWSSARSAAWMGA